MSPNLQLLQGYTVGISDNTPPEELDALGQPLYPYMDGSGMVDLSQIRCNLALTPAERLRRHDEFLMFVDRARRSNLKQDDTHAPTLQTAE